MEACFKGNNDIVQLLLQAKAEIDAQEEVRTPLLQLETHALYNIIFTMCHSVELMYVNWMPVSFPRITGRLFT